MTFSAAARPFLDIHRRATAALDRLSWSFLALPMRIAGFSVFWRSGQVKIEDWASTVELFTSEYRVPVLPPELAAYLATAAELGCSSLLLVGLATRFGALALLGMISVIQIFVYPSAWPDHLQWFAFLLPLVARGAGAVSLDAAISRSLGTTKSAHA